MAIPHTAPGQLVNVRPYGEQLAEHKTHSLFKSQQIEVLRLVLPAGKSIAEHRAPGEITVHCLEGRVQFTAMGETREMSAGEMLFLKASEPHAVHAVEDASVLVTIVLGRSAG